MSELMIFQHFATYKWMNRKVYQAAAGLTEEQLQRDVGAFFKSALGTLNHLLVGDVVWLTRFSDIPGFKTVLKPVAQLPTPTRLDQTVGHTLDDLSKIRHLLDETIIHWIQSMDAEQLDLDFTYRSMSGVAGTRRFGDVLLHFFNHQTHHRGQLSTVFSQFSVDLGVTDLLAMLRDNS